MSPNDSFLGGLELPRVLHLTDAEYNALVGERQTHLKACLKSPKHANVYKKTNSLQRGSWFDAMAKHGIEKFQKSVAVIPDINKTSNKGKSQYVDFLMEHGWKYKGSQNENERRVLAYKQLNSTAWNKGKELIPASDWSDLRFMYDSLMSYEMAQIIMDHSEHNLCLQWDSKDEDLPFEYRVWKCQFDFSWKEDQKTNGIDLKTDIDPSPDAFQKKVFDLGYDFQAAFYMKGLEECGINPGIWLWIAVETKEPWTTHVHYATPETMEIGWRRVQMAVDKLKAYLKDDKKRPYGTKVNHIKPPRWLDYQLKEYGY